MFTALKAALGSSGSGAVSITDRTFGATGAGDQTATYRLNSSGIVERGINASYTTLETWLLGGSAADYETRATLVSGVITSGTLSTWLSLSTTEKWSVFATAGGSQSAVLTIEIRLAASPFTVLDSATITITANAL